ncbi:MAG: PQQ-dependent sugar dehydrogenase [Actinomycetota bacterium]
MVTRRISPIVLLACFAWILAPESSLAAPSGPDLVAGDLSFPSNMTFAPDGRLFFAEKDSGDIRVIEDGRLLPDPFAHIDVLSSAEQGLLGIALDPNFDAEPWVYVYYSDPVARINRLGRFRADDDSRELQPLLDALTTEHGYHNGGDIAFGGDGKLFVSVGEVHEGERAQNPNDIGGKILRLNPGGTAPSDNPFGVGNPAYSMGHRNSFGLCFDPSNGDLWETENGPGSDDEVNLIEPGGNYGWPDQLGPGGEPAFIDPVVDFPEVIVPTGCAVWRGDLFFGAYGTGLLYRIALPLEADAQAFVVNDLGAGVTDLEVGPGGDLFVATSDAIWRFDAPGSPVSVGPEPGGSSGGESPGAGSNTAIVIVAGIVLAAGLVTRLIAGRRLRRNPSED